MTRSQLMALVEITLLSKLSRALQAAEMYGISSILTGDEQRLGVN